MDMQQPQTDPLYVIFEQHLYNFQDCNIDRKTFITNVITDYLAYLRKMNITVPKAMEGAVAEELASQIGAMLLKKIYGFPTISEFQKGATSTQKRQARRRYSSQSRKSERAARAKGRSRTKTA